MTPTPHIAGKTGIVTGAASGIGRAITLHLASSGANVIAVDLDSSGLEELGATDRNAGEIVAQVGDVRSEQVFIDAIETATSRGGLDFFVNNAGVDLQRDLESSTSDDWDDLFAVNARSAFFGCKHAVGPMMARGGGAIVNIGSSDSLQGDPIEPIYVATKHAVLGLTRAVASNERFARAGIRCNCVCPAGVDTPMLADYYASQPDAHAFRAAIVKAHPIGRVARPEEIAAPVGFLISDQAAFINGVALSVDGGLFAHFP